MALDGNTCIENEGSVSIIGGGVSLGSLRWIAAVFSCWQVCRTLLHIPDMQRTSHTGLYGPQWQNLSLR